MQPHRLNSYSASFPLDFPVKLFATPAVPLDPKGLKQVDVLATLWADLERLKDAQFLAPDAALEEGVFTPDFHAGPGIPVGTSLKTQNVLYPQLIGKDVSCGMRLIVLDASIAEIAHIGPKLDQALRHAFFQGGRDIAMSPEERSAILQHGLKGMPKSNHGLWPWMHPLADPLRHHNQGSWSTQGIEGLEDFIQGSGSCSRDGQIGSIGGGNHFVELNVVSQILDRRQAYLWGLQDQQAVILIHTGSVGIGAHVGDWAETVAKAWWPKTMSKPVSGFYPVPYNGPNSLGQNVLHKLGLAANFAVINRLCCGAMMVKTLSDLMGRRLQAQTLYDVPHNMIWNTGSSILHRKGASPAQDQHPVLLPGSMGTSSYILKGLGQNQSLESAPHGAGRALSRQKARSHTPQHPLRVILPMALQGLRPDIQKTLQQRLQEESPRAYKDIQPILETITLGGIASPVAHLQPFLTLKG